MPKTSTAEQATAQASSEDRAFYGFAVMGGGVLFALLFAFSVWSIRLVSFTQVQDFRHLANSLAVAAVAVAVAVPLGFAAGASVSVFWSRTASLRGSRVLDVLATVPSVVWIVPLCTFRLGLPPRLSLVAAGTALGLMLAPGFAASTRDWFENTPKILTTTGLGLGGRPWSVFRLVLFPLVRRGIIGSIGATFARAVGEAIMLSVVLRASGSLVTLAGSMAQASLQDAPRTNVLSSFGPSAALLLLATLPIQFLSRVWAHRPQSQASSATIFKYEMPSRLFGKTSFAVFALAFMLLTFSLIRLAEVPDREALRNLTATLLLIGTASAIAAPFGFAGAVAAVEFSAHAGAWAARVRVAGELLLSVPPIVIGVFTFSVVESPSLGGVFAFVAMMIPSLMRRSIRVLRSVKESERRAAIELGATRARTFLIVVVQGSRRALIGAVFAAAARTLGSTAPLLLVPSLGILSTKTFEASLRGNANAAASSGILLLLLVLALKGASIWLIRDHSKAQESAA
jgi:ABC-type phosphate transport system permease subunit